MRGLRIWGRRIGLAGPAIVLVGLAGVVAWTFAISWRPSAETYPIQGIDVSEEHGLIDWPTVRANGADFAYMRATRGADARDTMFAPNWSATYAAGMRRGAIHGFSLCRLAVDQARNFIVMVPRVADALPAAVEIEESPECGTPPARQVLIDEIGRFAAMVESHTGKPVLVMIPPEIEERYQLSGSVERTLWATGSFFPPTYLSRPWRMWRANARRRIEGADVAVNWDVVAR